MSLVGHRARNHPQQAISPEVDDRAITDANFAPLHERFRFTIDAAAAPHNAKLPRYWTAADSALAQSWAGERIWCNPPYSNSMSRVLVAVLAAAYVALVVLANVLTEHFGLVPIGFGLTCTAGTFAAGGVLLARNVTQDAAGRLLVLALMVVGCGLSWWLASPALAVASAVAFALSESTDMAVYTPLRKRGWSRAVLAAATVGAVVDTFVFLHLAGFPVTAESVTGQLVVKVGISAAVALLVGVGGAVLREPVHAESA